VKTKAVDASFCEETQREYLLAYHLESFRIYHSMVLVPQVGNHCVKWCESTLCALRPLVSNLLSPTQAESVSKPFFLIATVFFLKISTSATSSRFALLKANARTTQAASSAFAREVTELCSRRSAKVGVGRFCCKNLVVCSSCWATDRLQRK